MIIDNLCQIAHNVHIGTGTAVAGGVIMAGSLKVGRYCLIGGASVINGHMEICDKVTGIGGNGNGNVTDYRTVAFILQGFHYKPIRNGVKPLRSP